MKSKFMLISVMLISMLQHSFYAATIYANDGTEIKTNSTICANDTYYYESGDNGIYEGEIISSNSRILLDTATARDGVLELMFPSNIENISVNINNYGETGRQLVDIYDFTITDCGYEQVVTDFKETKPKVTIEQSGTNLAFSNSDDNYNLYYNEVDANDDGKFTKVKFKGGEATITPTESIIQLTEVYTNADGEEVTRYFEIEIGENIVVRKLSNLELTIIEPLDYIDISILLRIILGLIVLIILFLINIQLMKKYKAKKVYRKKLKMYRIKKREAEIQKQQRLQAEKRKRYELQKAKKEDQKRRANLEIRK